MNIRTINVFGLAKVIKHYQLDPVIFNRIVLMFLSHRREELLNEELFRYFSPYEFDIKIKIKPILYQLMNELDYSDNVEDFFIKNNIFYIKDHPNDAKPEQPALPNNLYYWSPRNSSC